MNITTKRYMRIKKVLENFRHEDINTLSKLKSILVVFKFSKKNNFHTKLKIRTQSLCCLRKYTDKYVLITDDLFLKYGYFFPCASAVVSFISNITDYKYFFSEETALGIITEEKDFPSKIESLIDENYKKYGRLYIGAGQKIYDLFNGKVDAIIVYEITPTPPHLDSKKIDDEIGYDSPNFVIGKDFVFDYNESDIIGKETEGEWSYRRLVYKKDGK